MGKCDCCIALELWRWILDIGASAGWLSKVLCMWEGRTGMLTWRLRRGIVPIEISRIALGRRLHMTPRDSGQMSPTCCGQSHYFQSTLGLIIEILGLSKRRGARAAAGTSTPSQLFLMSGYWSCGFTQRRSSALYLVGRRTLSSHARNRQATTSFSFSTWKNVGEILANAMWLLDTLRSWNTSPGFAVTSFERELHCQTLRANHSVTNHSVMVNLY